MALTRPKIWDIDTNITMFNDPITVLHQGATSANVDVGFLFNRANGLVSNVALYWNESTQNFITAYTTSSGTTDSNITVTSYANVTMGNVSATGNISVGGTTPALITAAGTNSNLTIDPDGSGSIILSANTSVNYTTVSTSTTTGALTVAGGVGIAGNAYIGGNITAGNVISTVYAPTVNINSTAGMYNVLNVTGAALLGYGSSQTWKFFTQNAVPGGPGSWILFPDSTYQYTAYPGTNTSGTAALSLTTLNAATIGNIGANVNGTGTYLTALNASNLTSGTVPNAQLSGQYSNVTGLGTLATLSVTGNASVGGNLSVGNLNISSGNITVSNAGSFIGNAVTGYGALYAGIPNGYAVLPSTPLQVATNANTYSQLNMQNINNGSIASSDYVLTAGNGTDSTFYGDFGIASNTYSYPGLSAIGPNDVYVIAAGYNTAGPYTGNVGNLVLNSSNGQIKFVVGGGNQNNTIATIVGNSLAVNSTTTSTSTTTGALTVAGGVGISGNINASGNVYAIGTNSRHGYTWANSVSSAYTVFNAATNSIDTVFG